MLMNTISPDDYDLFENSSILYNVFTNHMSKKQQVAHINSLIEVLKKKEDYEKCAKLTEYLKQYEDVKDNLRLDKLNNLDETNTSDKSDINPDENN